MTGRAEYLLCLPFFDNLAQIENNHPVAGLADSRKIMGNQKVGYAIATAQIPKQAHQLRSGFRRQRGGGFIKHHEVGSSHHCARHGYTLLEAS